MNNQADNLNNNSKIFFTVIIPVHNKLPHLERSVNSALNQTYRNFELILINDASTDGSSEKLQQFEDNRIRIFTRDTPGPGGYAARNLGLKHAKHEWICFLDADDEWEENVLEELTLAIENDPEVEILSWAWYKSSGKNKELDGYAKANQHVKQKEFSLTEFLIGPQMIWTGAAAFKKELFDKAGGFPEQGFRRGGDLDTWIRCLWYSKKNLWLNKPMSYYHVDSVNMVTNNSKGETVYVFSSFLKEIIAKEKDPELKKAVFNFQNRHLYNVLNYNVYQGKSIDYKLLRKMNFNSQFIMMAVKLHLNKIRFLFK